MEKIPSLPGQGDVSGYKPIDLGEHSANYVTSSHECVALQRLQRPASGVYRAQDFRLSEPATGRKRLFRLPNQCLRRADPFFRIAVASSGSRRRGDVREI